MISSRYTYSTHARYIASAVILVPNRALNLGSRGDDACGGIDLPSDRLERCFDPLPESSVG